MPKQTYKICIAAINKNAYALQYVREQTLELCTRAINKNIRALQYVHADHIDTCKEFIREKYKNSTIEFNINTECLICLQEEKCAISCCKQNICECCLRQIVKCPICRTELIKFADIDNIINMYA